MTILELRGKPLAALDAYRATGDFSIDDAALLVLKLRKLRDHLGRCHPSRGLYADAVDAALAETQQLLRDMRADVDGDDFNPLGGGAA